MNMTIDNKNEIPWHRQPLVWMLIAIPFSAIVMGVIMILLAVNSEDGLVADDYYKKGLEINRVIYRDQKAAELGLGASLNFDAGSNVINMSFERGSLEVYPETIDLHIQHATRENSDINVTMQRGMNNQYIGYLDAKINLGVWYFSLAGDDWKLSTRSHVQQSNQIMLKNTGQP